MAGIVVTSVEANDASSVKGPVLLGVSITTTLMALLLCCGRFLVRKRLGQTIGLDDAFLGAAMVVGLVGMGFTIREAMSTTDGTEAARYHFTAQPWLLMGSTLARVSICMCLMRTIGRQLGVRQMTLAALTGVIMVVTLVAILIKDLQCQPIQLMWDATLEGGYCLKRSVGLNTSYFYAVFEMVTFFGLGLFPIFLTRNLLHGVGCNQWPLLALALPNLLAAVLCIVKTYELSVNGNARGFRANLATITLLGILIQNLAICAANVMPLSTLIAYRGVRLPSSGDIELNGAKSPSTTNLIRSLGKMPNTSAHSLNIHTSPQLINSKINDPEWQWDSTTSHAKPQPTARGHKANRSGDLRTTAPSELAFRPSLGNGDGDADGLGSPMKLCIFKTTSFEVIEEEYERPVWAPRKEDEFRTHTKVNTAGSEEWKRIMKGSES